MEAVRPFFVFLRRPEHSGEVAILIQPGRGLFGKKGEAQLPGLSLEQFADPDAILSGESLNEFRIRIQGFSNLPGLVDPGFIEIEYVQLCVFQQFAAFHGTAQRDDAQRGEHPDQDAQQSHRSEGQKEFGLNLEPILHGLLFLSRMRSEF